MVVAVGALYVRYSGLPIVQSLFYGIAPAVRAIITLAAVKLVKLTDRRDWRLWAISATVFGLTAATGSEPIAVILCAGLLMIGLDARPGFGWLCEADAHRQRAGPGSENWAGHHAPG